MTLDIVDSRRGRGITLDVSPSMPPYEQVRVQLASQIVDGVLAVGTRLPTVRGLAAELGLATNTVARAYRELEEAGLVETKGRAGTFVSAAGEQSRVRAEQAARQYAAATAGLGLNVAELLEIVRAALPAQAP
ncbi:MAG TPA: GntR family transcriptional regulator [Mycobacteriales bacterium]|nr:GntR family transcriptional regulator [Mycobacteriales bacterium]